MTVVRPLDLGALEQLGPLARRGVYWQTDGAAAEENTTFADAEFVKEAWISHVMLEWGQCGQLAEHESRAVGAVFYAPPGMVPRAGRQPTAPVGADAVLLTGVVEEYDCPAGVRARLLDAMVADLRSRGVKAVEVFGLDGEPEAGEELTPMAPLVEHGFEVVARDPRVPRLRLDIDSDHLWKVDVERALDQLFAERGLPSPRERELTTVCAARAQTPTR